MANNVFQVKRTSTSGRTPNTTGSYVTNSQYIAAGEFALNMADGILYTSNGSAVIEIGANNSVLKSTSTITATGIVSGSELTSTLASGDEGGQINLAKPPNATTAGGVTIDAYQNKIRIFEQGGNARGAYIDLTACANGVGTNLLTGGGTGTVTSVGSANGIAGGPITGSGTLYAVAGNSTLYVNASGIHVNLESQYTWSNTQTFSANVSFNGNGIGIVSNTGAVYLGGITDVNWRIGRNTGATTKWRYTNNSIDIITANSNLEGMSIGLINGNSYFETGYLGTFIASNVTIGNTSSNATINSTSFSGTANNATNLGGVAAGSYQTTAGLSANVATLTANNTSFVGTVSAANVVSNAQLSGNLANYVTTTNLTNNLANYQTTAGLSANVATLTANNANFVKANNGITSNSTGVFVTQGTGTVVNATGVHVNATYIGTISANNASFLGGTAAASYVQNTDSRTLSGNLVISGTSFTPSSNTVLLGNSTQRWVLSANTGSFSGAVSGITTLAAGNTTITGFANVSTSVNSALLTVGTSFVANTLGAYHTGTVNAASLTVGSSTIANTTGVYTGVANASTLSTGTTFIANSSQVTVTVPVSANGSTGTAGHVLTSNGTVGSPYWASATGGGYYKGGSAAVGTLAVGGQNLFRVNANTLNFNTTIATGENAQATGPISVGSGITLTVESGARVSIV